MALLDPGRAPKRYEVVGVGVVVTIFENAQGIVNTQQTVMKLRIRIHDLIPDRSNVLDFLLYLLFLFISSIIH